MARTDFNQLLEAGVHFGHLKRKWNPKMAPYIFMEKNGIHIIDLHKTAVKLDEASAALKQIAKSGRRILFVATKRQAKDVVSEKVEAMGMPYVTERWPGGMLTNFPTIRKAIKKMSVIDKMNADGTFAQFSKRERLQISRQRAKLEKNLGSIADLTRLPAALFVIDVQKEANAVKEAKRLNIPVFAMVDTCCDPTQIDYVIPANDDASKSVAAILDVVGAAITEGLSERKAEKEKEGDAAPKEPKLRKRVAKKEEAPVAAEPVVETAEVAAEAAEVAKLRKMTGAGMMDCKKALIEANGDYERAQEIIREKGKLVASKRADREASEGMVVSKIVGKKAYMLALACETDFVARTEGFIATANEILEVAVAADAADTAALLATTAGNGTIEELITDKSGQTGEKVQLAFYAQIEAEQVVSYIHTNNKLGTIVGFNAEVPESVAKDVAMQAAAMAPVSISKDDCPAEVIEKERHIGHEQARLDGKPEAMLDKIAEGKVNKFLKDNTLLNQDLVKNNKISVAQFIKEANADATVVAYQRFTLND